METTIRQINEVEFAFEVNATAADLEPEIARALRTQRARSTMRGFRPGRVPLSLVKKLYGKTVGEAVAAETVQKAYEAEVLERDAHQVLGQPTMTAFEYEPGGDLHAVVQFGVRPSFELKDLTGETVSKLVRPVTDADVEEEILRLRKKEADLVPVEEPATVDDYVVIDLQRLDEGTDTPIIGEKQEDVAFMLKDEEQPEALRSALVGMRPGESLRLDLPHGHGDHVHTHRYAVTVKDVKRQELPELDADFIKGVTKDRLEDEAALREEIRSHLVEAWERRGREMMEEEMVERMVDLHPIPVPSSVIEMYLDSFVKDLESYVGGELPPGFDEARYRADRRPDAERQARWMFIRDRLIEEEALAVTDEDRQAFFEKTAGDGKLTPEVLRQYYKAMPGLSEQLDQRLINEKVFAFLASRFDIIEKDLETMEAEAEVRRTAGAVPASEAPKEETAPVVSDDD